MTEQNRNLTQNANKSLTLRERLEAKKHFKNACLILDVSGSMAVDLEPGLTKINALRDIVKEIKGNPMVITFNDYVEANRSVNNIPDPRGGTYMSKAFDLAKELKFTEALLITDGIANDKAQALEAVKGLKLQIMYIGAAAKPPFLDELMKASGGIYATKEDLKKPKELTEKIQLALGPASGNESYNKGPIIL